MVFFYLLRLATSGRWVVKNLQSSVYVLIECLLVAIMEGRTYSNFNQAIWKRYFTSWMKISPNHRNCFLYKKSYYFLREAYFIYVSLKIENIQFFQPILASFGEISTFYWNVLANFYAKVILLLDTQAKKSIIQ